MKVTEIFLSPGGTTRKISNLFCTYAGFDKTTQIDLLNKKQIRKQRFSSEEVLVVTLPVFAGRIPEMAAKQLETMKGENTPAIALVVYGNREYDDALIEFTDIMTASGFSVYGAGAFIARHSIFPQVAKNRPDKKDKKILLSFATQCVKKIKKGEVTEIQVKGKRPYKEYTSSMPIKPTGNKSCTKCGLCVKRCPVNAIDASKPRRTNKKKCISCTACIYTCPMNARSFHGVLYKIASMKFEKKCNKYREPDLFI